MVAGPVVELEVGARQFPRLVEQAVVEQSGQAVTMSQQVSQHPWSWGEVGPAIAESTRKRVQTKAFQCLYSP